MGLDLNETSFRKKNQWLNHPLLLKETNVMLMITLYAEQKKRHRFIEQSFRLCVRRRGRDVSREQHRNMYTIKGETDYQPRLDA